MKYVMPVKWDGEELGVVGRKTLHDMVLGVVDPREVAILDQRCHLAEVGGGGGGKASLLIRLVYR